ncbi:MAG TPA: tetratricopeptide repeat protein [Terriglobales bacterium]|nr:tetratricopeptide repeat protein [Terriglobales bacterium]
MRLHCGLRIAATGICLLLLVHPSLSTTRKIAGPQTDATPPGSKDASFADVEKLLEQGRFDEAIASLGQLQKSDPELKGLAHEYGVAYYRKGDYFQAAQSLRQALEKNPADDEAVQLLGLSLYLSGKPGEAIPYLQKVQSWFPSANVDAAYILGVSYIQTKDYDAARGAFAKMFGVPAESASAYLFTARMLLRFDFGPIAEEYGRKAIQLDPKLPLAHELLGELYLYESKIPEATAELEKELAINPGSAVTYYKLADAYSRVQRFDDAERLLQRSIWLDATSTGPYILLGKVLEKKGETALAVRALQRALTMDPRNPIPHHLLGQAYRDLGREADAERELKLAEQLQAGQDAKQP